MLMMEELIEIVKQTYPTLPALPGNFREKRALLEAVNVRLAEAGRTAVDEPTLNEAVLAIAPGARFENEYYRGDGATVAALRMIYPGCEAVVVLTEEARRAAHGQIVGALARIPAEDGWYNMIDLGPVLKEAGFDYKRLGFKTMTAAMQHVFGCECPTAERPVVGKPPQRFIRSRVERRAAPQQPGRREAPAADDREAVCRAVCRILHEAMPQGAGCYSMTRLVPVFRAAGFDIAAYGHKRVKDFLEGYFGDAFRMEDRGSEGHPNIFAWLPVARYVGAAGGTETPKGGAPARPAAPAPARPAGSAKAAPKNKRQSAFAKMMDFAFFKPQGGENGWTAAIRQLASTALRENWYYGTTDPGTYPILNNYLLMTFERLLAEDKAHEGDAAWKTKIRVRTNESRDFFVDRWKEKVRNRVYPERVAVFNTGLVDHLYEPIYAVFHSNLKAEDRHPWMFWQFVCSTDTARQTLTRVFGTDLPEAAHYYNSTLDLVYDVRKQIGSVNWDHIIDHCERLPVEFLRDNGPDRFDYDRRDSSFYQDLAAAIKSTPRVYNRIKNRIEDAMDYAVKRVRWNFKTAIPIYYPGREQISLLLPLALVDEDRIDVALVLEATGSDAYIAHTVLTLKMAYTNARLITRPDSDWLTSETIQGSSSEAEIESDMEE